MHQDNFLNIRHGPLKICAMQEQLGGNNFQGKKKYTLYSEKYLWELGSPKILSWGFLLTVTHGPLGVFKLS